MENLVTEAISLANEIKNGGDLSDLNKQADLVLDLAQDKTVLCQTALDTLIQNYGIEEYRACDGEKTVAAKIFGTLLVQNLLGLLQNVKGKKINNEEEFKEKVLIATNNFLVADATYEELFDYVVNYDEEFQKYKEKEGIKL